MMINNCILINNTIMLEYYSKRIQRGRFIEMLTTMESELTHAHNILDIAYEQIEYALESGSTDDLNKVLSLILKADNTVTEQIDTILEAKTTK